MNEERRTPPERRLFIIVGFAIGARNDMFLNCGDFKISGNDLPANCVPATPDL